MFERDSAAKSYKHVSQTEIYCGGSRERVKLPRLLECQFPTMESDFLIRSNTKLQNNCMLAEGYFWCALRLLLGKLLSLSGGTSVEKFLSSSQSRWDSCLSRWRLGQRKKGWRFIKEKKYIYKFKSYDCFPRWSLTWKFVAWVWILALPLPSHTTQGKIFNFSMTWFFSTCKTKMTLLKRAAVRIKHGYLWTVPGI